MNPTTHHHGHPTRTTADDAAPHIAVAAKPVSEGPRLIGSILDEILASPGGLAGEARRILAAKGGVS